MISEFLTFAAVPSNAVVWTLRIDFNRRHAAPTVQGLGFGVWGLSP
jgi:hypothetical protein